MYHLNEAGEPRLCSAKKGHCPYEKSSPHFETEEEARAFFENERSTFTRAERIPHTMALSPKVIKLLEDLRAEGLTPYVVGGSVRDSLLSGEAAKDIDIEVFGAENMETLEKALRKARYSVDSVGKSFGVLKTRLGSKEDIDISLPRRDSKTDQGHRGFSVEVDSTLSLEEAAGRRDFTINSLYYDQESAEVLDPFGGMKDYKKGHLRHVNDHFAEDPLRVCGGSNSPLVST